MDKSANETIRISVGPGQRSWRRYIALFLAISIVSGLSGRALDRGFASLGCYSAAGADEFLAYCASPQFGDYEHGAYYYDLEPTAVADLVSADVVFFGTSRMQFAFSTREVARYFALYSIRPYLLGFGYNEAAAFPLALIRKYHAAPKAIVINADPFFRDTATGLVRVGSGPLPRWRAIPELYEYLQKKYFLAVLPGLCKARPSACEPAIPTIYRSRHDGFWTRRNYPASQSRPIAGAAITYSSEMAAADLGFADTFLRSTGVPRQCVVLTAVPSSAIGSDEYVDEMGRLLGVRVSLPRLNGLETFDGSHLTEPSAERWSAAFLQDVGSVLATCAGR